MKYMNNWNKLCCCQFDYRFRISQTDIGISKIYSNKLQIKWLGLVRWKADSFNTQKSLHVKESSILEMFFNLKLWKQLAEKCFAFVYPYVKVKSFSWLQGKN